MMTMPEPQSLSIVIDLRSRWNSIRDQGGRNSCLACASSDAHMFAQNLDHPLSAEYLFFQASQLMRGNDVSQGLTFHAVQSALRDHGQPHEDEWPYQTVEPTPWLPPVVTTIWFADLVLNPEHEISTVVSVIRSGGPVVLAIRLTSEFINFQGSHCSIPPSGPGFGGHAVTVVGLGVDLSGSEFFLIRNSWGSEWGIEGYAWLPVQYLVDKMIGFGTAMPRRMP